MRPGRDIFVWNWLEGEAVRIVDGSELLLYAFCVPDVFTFWSVMNIFSHLIFMGLLKSREDTANKVVVPNIHMRGGILVCRKIKVPKIMVNSSIMKCNQCPKRLNAFFCFLLLKLSVEMH